MMSTQDNQVSSELGRIAQTGCTWVHTGDGEGYFCPGFLCSSWLAAHASASKISSSAMALLSEIEQCDMRVLATKQCIRQGGEWVVCTTCEGEGKPGSFQN
jgi:hypothetical protein